MAGHVAGSTTYIAAFGCQRMHIASVLSSDCEDLGLLILRAYCLIGSFRCIHARSFLLLLLSSCVFTPQ